MKKDIKTFTTRYLGSKLKLLEWLDEEIDTVFKENNVKTVVDAFAGTHIVSYMFKQQGYRVLSNDFLLFNYFMGKGVIENNKVSLSEEEILRLLTPRTSSVTFIQDEYTDVYFPIEDTIFLDNLYLEIQELDCEYKKAIAMSSISQAILKKAPYGRFTTTTMRNIGKKTMVEYFETTLRQFNALVLDNSEENVAYSEDSIELLPKLEADAVYFDPPYGGKSFSKYEHFYNFTEVYANYWKDEVRVGKLKQVKKKESVFSYGKNHTEYLDLLLHNSNHIPIWVFSYNNNGGMPIEKLIEMISKYKKNVEVKEISYEYANKLRSYSEFLIIAKDE